MAQFVPPSISLYLGTYVLNASSCEDCPSGYYAPTAQVDACLACDAGSHTGMASKATTCSSCDGGTYSQGRAVNCSTCSAGTASATRADSCTSCGEFESEDAIRHTTPSLNHLATLLNHHIYRCPTSFASTNTFPPETGTWSDEGAASCVRCTAGKYTSAANSTECLNCTRGTYASSEGSSTCGQFREQHSTSVTYYCLIHPRIYTHHRGM